MRVTKVEKLRMLMMLVTTAAGACDGRRRRHLSTGAPSSLRILLLLPLLQTVGAASTGEAERLQYY